MTIEQEAQAFADQLLGRVDTLLDEIARFSTDLGPRFSANTQPGIRPGSPPHLDPKPPPSSAKQQSTPADRSKPNAATSSSSPSIPPHSTSSFVGQKTLVRNLTRERDNILGYLDEIRNLHKHHTHTTTTTTTASSDNPTQHQAKPASQNLSSSPDSTRQRELLQKLQSTNLGFFEMVWHQAKRRPGLVCFHQPRKPVDVVVNGGREWIKVVNTTMNSLLHQMTHAGWEWEAADEDSEDDDLKEEDNADNSDDHPDKEQADSLGGSRNELALRSMTAIEAVRYALDSLHEARLGAVSAQDHRRPRVRLVLPRIHRHVYPDVDKLLDMLATLGPPFQQDASSSSTGVQLLVDCAQTIEHHDGDAPPPPSDDNWFSRMQCIELQQNFTDWINLDCTTLYILCSDFCHDAWSVWTDPHDQNTPDVRHERDHGPCLPQSLYPLLAGRRLVCCRDAATTFLETVSRIGTPTEIQRARLLMAGHQSPPDLQVDIPACDPNTIASHEEVGTRRALAVLSRYPVPASLRLPICVLDDDDEDGQKVDVASVYPSSVLHAIGVEATASTPPPVPARPPTGHNPQISQQNRFKGATRSTFRLMLSRRLTTITANASAAITLSQIIAETRQVWVTTAEKLFQQAVVASDVHPSAHTDIGHPSSPSQLLHEAIEWRHRAERLFYHVSLAPCARRLRATKRPGA